MSDGNLGRIVSFHEADQAVEVRRSNGRSLLMPVSVLAHELRCTRRIRGDQSAS